MKFVLFVFILFFQFVFYGADDEELSNECSDSDSDFIDFLPMISEIRFIYNPIGGSQHKLLDKLYRNYFSEKNEFERKKISEKIAIYTHIYMLSHKMEKNKEKLSKILFVYLEEEEKQQQNTKKRGKVVKKEAKVKTVAYAFYKGQMLRLMFNYRMRLDFKVTQIFDTHLKEPILMCKLLKFKMDILATLKDNGNSKQKTKTMATECESDEAIQETIAANSGNIKEFVFSDILHFLTTRKNLLEYFEGIKEEKKKWKFVKMAFIELVGFPMMAVICATYSDHLSFLIPSFDDGFFLKLYQNYFFETNWRHKIILGKFLYDDWATKFFSNKLNRSINQKSNFVADQFKEIFVSKLKFLWQLYTQNFWTNEKIIRTKNENFSKEKSKGKMVKNVSESLSAHRQQLAELEWHNNQMDYSLLLENGPSDTFLLRALAICAKETVAEFGKNFPKSATKIEKLEEFLSEYQSKFLICVGKNLKKTFRMDEFLSELHFHKWDNLLSDVKDGEIFKEILTEHKHLWIDLLNPNEIKKLKLLLTEKINYSTAPEFLSSEEDEKEEEEHFTEAQNEFEEGNCDKNGQISETENGQIGETEKEIWERIKSIEKKLPKKKKNYQTKNKKIYKKTLKNEQNAAKIEEKEQKDEKENAKIGEKKSDKMTTRQNANNGKMKMDKAKLEVKNEQKIQINLNIKKDKTETNKENGLKKALGQIGIEKTIDLLNEKKLIKLYKIYLEDGQFVEYLDMAMLFNSIETMAKFIKNRTENYSNKKLLKEFEEKWGEFKQFELHRIIGQFVLDKLFFVQKELQKELFGPIENILPQKVIEIVGEFQWMKIGKKNSFADENFDNFYRSQKYIEQTMRISQFGAYKIETFFSILSQFHLQIFSIFAAENFLNLLEETKCQNNESKTKCKRLGKILPKNWQEMLKKGVKTMELAEKQRKLIKKSFLVNNFHEFGLYNLIRSSPESRQSDVDLSNQIDQLISSYSIEKNKKLKIAEILKKIDSIVKEWAIKFTKIEAKLLKNGSHLLNAELKFSDLDLLCVVSDEINLSHFYGKSEDNLYTMLGQRLNNGAIVSWISGRVPLIRIESDHIEMDILLVPVKKKFLMNGTDLENDEIIGELVDQSAIYSLAGYRSGKYQLSLIDDHNTFVSLLKAVKIWAKNRLIYSGIFGFFNGAALSVMATKISLLFPNAPLIYLLFQFFRIYSQFDWLHDQLLLDTVSPTSLNPLAQIWPPTVEGCPMAIITPKFPEQNASFNVDTFTHRTIVNELKIANQILAENPKNWQMIFEEIDYRQKYEHYAVIWCFSISFDIYRTNCAYQKSKIRKTLHKWAKSEENSTKLDHYQIIPQSERKTKCKTKKKDYAFCTIWLVGLTLGNEFGQNVNALGPIYEQNPNSGFPSFSVLLRSLYTRRNELMTIINGLIS